MPYKLPKDCQIECIDKIYDYYFGSTPGVFVEVGAYDGHSYSNTSFLADCGWGGLYIEPIFDSYKICFNRHYYNKVDVECFAIGSIEGEVDFYSSQGNYGGYQGKSGIGYCQYSTSDVRQMYRTKNIDWMNHIIYEKKRIPQYRLETILSNKNLSPGFELLVVDVEGNEYDVFKSFDLNFWKPKMMIVELKDNNEKYSSFVDYIEECKFLRSMILRKGYIQIYSDDINTIFVDQGLDIPSYSW